MTKKEKFESALDDWRADNAGDFDDLEIVEIYEEDGECKALAQDGRCSYEISDRGNENLEMNYLGTI